MHKELEVMKPRCNGLWKRCTGTAAFVYFWILANVPAVAFAKDEKGNATDTGVKEVTDGINVIKDLVLGCVGGVRVIFIINVVELKLNNVIKPSADQSTWFFVAQN